MKPTKFILHGGDSSSQSPYNDDYFKEFANSGEKILLAYFDREREEWNKRSEQDSGKIAKYNPKAETEIADPDKFLDQLDWCDVLYFRGGIGAPKIIEKLPQTSTWFPKMQEKVLVGSSAGAYTLSKYYIGNDNQKLGKGLGILDLKIYCHFKEEKDMQAIERLKAAGDPDTQILVIPDYKHVVLFG